MNSHVRTESNPNMRQMSNDQNIIFEYEPEPNEHITSLDLPERKQLFRQPPSHSSIDSPNSDSFNTADSETNFVIEIDSDISMDNTDTDMDNNMSGINANDTNCNYILLLQLLFETPTKFCDWRTFIYLIALYSESYLNKSVYVSYGKYHSLLNCVEIG